MGRICVVIEAVFPSAGRPGAYVLLDLGASSRAWLIHASQCRQGAACDSSQVDVVQSRWACW